MEHDFVQKEIEGPRGWTIWQVEGRIDIQTAATAYQQGEVVVKKSEKTVIDMSRLEYLSSAGLRVLLRLNKLALKSGKLFTVAAPAGMVRAVLEDSGMDELLQLRESMEDLE